MPSVQDGPGSSLFSPITFKGNVPLSKLPDVGISNEMARALELAPTDTCVGWGIPFEIGDVIAILDQAVSVELSPTQAHWLVFMHTSDLRPPDHDPGGFTSPMRGEGQLAEHAADYVILYDDGTEERVHIRRRHQIGAFQRRWGENCFEAVSHHTPFPRRTPNEQLSPGWGPAQTRVVQPTEIFREQWINWLWAWENPHLGKTIVGVRFEPVTGLVLVSAISAGDTSSCPLRWMSRRKACLVLAQGESFLPDLDENGLLQQVQLDMGQIISGTPRPVYPNDTWSETDNNQLPETSTNEVLIEYTAHPEACFHLSDGQVIPVSQVEIEKQSTPLQFIPAATQRVKLRVLERGGGQVPVKLHVHGEMGEYLAPVDRHRILNPAWFEDYSVDFMHLDHTRFGAGASSEPIDSHSCTYIPGETTINLPLGKVFIEISKGFEIQPVRKVFEVTSDTREIEIEIEKVLPWREKGWVTADTHVHFLSPMSALLEGSAEGVNVVNLLASQWGELVTNVGDFDGQTTWGSKEAGGDGDYLVRVGTENRQHVLGHISLLGYRGGIIAPMTTGGPGESAPGDPIEILLTEWARQCKAQGGLVVLPHFPNPRAENAASIVGGDIDALEMTSWGNLYVGIDPYSLSDWYRYLNCGYLVPVVGGTDKMSASTAVGTVRTYAHIDPGEPFTYETWMEAVRRADTFVTYGPLLEFAVDGQPMGSRIDLSANGGTLDVTWQVASVTIPMSRVELIVNGEIRESLAVPPDEKSGHWSIKVEESSWLALLVRGHYADKPEIIAAHSSPVMINVEGSLMLPVADALTILEQIEGALAYLDTIGTRADDVAYKRMRLVLTSAHRTFHNRMHQLGHYHDHSIGLNHMEHNEG
ncbi:MAG: CehA/McbA family metallohydrolase [Anaerolineaceae bacterium]|nr:MAG: CehA/McbA family metallohydrolase [Anaerolineaceae bacterium]